MRSKFLSRISDKIYIKGNFKELIIYIFEKLSHSYNLNQQKLLLFALTCLYGASNSNKKFSLKYSKQLMFAFKHIYLDKNLNTDEFKDPSPVNG